MKLFSVIVIEFECNLCILDSSPLMYNMQIFLHIKKKVFFCCFGHTCQYSGVAQAINSGVTPSGVKGAMHESRRPYACKVCVWSSELSIFQAHIGFPFNVGLISFEVWKKSFSLMQDHLSV